MSISRFSKNEIMSLTGEAPQSDLAESVGPDLWLSERSVSVLSFEA